ncbi:MAG: hypothetical protein MSS78_06400 [Bacteroidales bacterium]|nr:hypothetical protein [Bacteroidales bacterium]
MKILKHFRHASVKTGLFMAIVTASASCSLKEDRDGCPCHLIIDLDNAVGNGNADIFIFQDGEEVLADNVVPADYPEGYRHEVRRRPASATVIQGLEESVLNGGRLVIRDGNDADRLFLYNETLQCGSETVRAAADLHKNWTTLEISLAAEEDEDSPAGNVRIDISGGICGMDLRNGAPVRGDFQCIARLADSGFAVYAVNLPRQISSEDEILIAVSRNGKELFSCDISEAISRTGFDWNKPDLDDIRLRLDYISASVNVEISEWETSPESDKVI